MARSSRGVSGLVVALIITLLVLLVVSTYLSFLISGSATKIGSRMILQDFMFQASQERARVDLDVEVIGGNVTRSYLLRNYGDIPITIVRIWAYQNGLLKIFSLSQTIDPGSYINLNETCRTLGIEDPGDILFAVTARGNIISISAEYYALSGVNLTSYLLQRASQTQTSVIRQIVLTVDNLANLLNRTDAYYKSPTDQECNHTGTPKVDIIDPVLAPYKALMIYMKESGNDKSGYNIKLTNGQSACNRYVFRDLVAYASQSGNVNNYMYISVLAGIYAHRDNGEDDDLVYVDVYVSLIDKNSGLVVAHASQTIAYILYSSFSAYYFQIPTFMKLDDRFLDPNYLRNRYFDLEISIILRLVAKGGDEFTFRIGVLKITFLGADLKI